MICAVTFIENAVCPSGSIDDIMGMPAIGATPVPKPFPFGNRSESTFAVTFRCVDHDEVCLFALNFAEARIYPFAVVNN